LNMLSIALEIAAVRPAYEDIATKVFRNSEIMQRRHIILAPSKKLNSTKVVMFNKAPPAHKL